GTISSAGNGNAFALVDVLSGQPSCFEVLDECQAQVQSYTSNIHGVFDAPAPIQFVYGQPFGLEIVLYALAGTVTPLNNGFALGSATGQGAGSTQLLNTFILTGLNPTDAAGDEAIGAQFSSGSGTEYSTSGVVAEPSSGTLLAFGLVLLTVFRFRRSR